MKKLKKITPNQKFHNYKFLQVFYAVKNPRNLFFQKTDNLFFWNNPLRKAAKDKIICQDLSKT